MELKLEPVSIYPGMEVTALEQWGTLTLKAPLMKTILESYYPPVSRAPPHNNSDPQSSALMVERSNTGEYKVSLSLFIEFRGRETESGRSVLSTLAWNDATIDYLSTFANREVCTMFLRYNDMALRELEERAWSEVFEEQAGEA
jgi:hypothetical protein